MMVMKLADTGWGMMRLVAGWNKRLVDTGWSKMKLVAGWNTRLVNEGVRTVVDIW